MANATAKVQSTTTPWGDDKIKRDLAATAATYYPGSMIAVNGDGYAVKCTDASGLRFDGIMADSFRITVDSDDAAGDKKVTVEKPWLMRMTIASAAITDIGRKVYAKYDNEVAYSGVTHSILVGVVEAYVDATTVLVRPYWTSTSGVNAFDGEALTFTGATGANEILVPDNLADGLSIKEGSTAYLTFVTTNSAELINVLKTLKFGGTTGNNIIGLVDNLADALSVKEGSTSYLKFTTTNSGERVVLGKNLVLAAGATLAAAGSAQGDAAAIVSQITYVSAADGTTGVVLPAAATSEAFYLVYNLHATAGLKIYPASGDDINDGSADAAITIEGKTMALFFPLDAATWASIFTANS